jgi:two-component system, OmpR family, phosphate regulon response regulator PhoB
MSTILVVEDDAAVRSLLVFLLKRDGHALVEAESGQEARAAVIKQVPDLVLLDRMLPDVDGLEMLRDWRRQSTTAQLPIIMLTARAEEDDRVEGLRSGADDYVTKPFSRTELLLRIQKLIQRNGNGSGKSQGLLQVEGLRIDRRGVRVAMDDEIVPLGAIEFRLLDLLASNADRVHTRGEIIDKVWTRGGYVDPRTVDVHVRRLRKVLERRGYDRFIQTVRGVGYRFSCEPV